MPAASHATVLGDQLQMPSRLVGVVSPLRLAPRSNAAAQ